ncbi:MAG: transketolase [Gammaproteobacteria bacterium]
MASTPGTAIGTPTRRELANAVRALAMDAVQAANSGHPGMPMGMADIAEVLWNDFLRHNPANPRWPNRDRFVLSNGHGSMLLYAVAHLTGYPIDIDELRNFRQLGSRTAGHPEYDLDIGIETTTGPLGQGLSNAVGMALAESILAARFNRPGFAVVDHYTYVFLGDGCLMEGISHEVCSLAGTLGLGKLVCFYDDNGISIDGKVEGWFRDDTPQRFRAYGWDVHAKVDGHDPEAVKAAISGALDCADRPSLICCQTVIGYGAPNLKGSEKTHGAPLGEDEVAAARVELGWAEPPFSLPASILDGWNAGEAGARRERDWHELIAQYRSEHPELAEELERRLDGALPTDWPESADAAIEAIATQTDAKATRKASLDALNAFAPRLPELVGGSADLTGSNCTLHAGSKVVTAENDDGNYLYFGVREFGMAAILNGMALHGGLIPYGGTFLTFADYARSALRMAALMRVGSIFVFTHDSIGLGEDGPTHQPVEHLESLRIMPNMRVWRPCDGVETAIAWRDAIERRDGPTSLALTRQSLPQQSRSTAQEQAVRRGGYVLHGDETAQVLLIATGSEVQLAMAAARELEAGGVATRVVSMPCVSLFDAQPEAYRQQVLPPGITHRVAIEAGVTAGWHRFVGAGGRIIGLDRYGASAPGAAVFEHFGFTPQRVVEVVTELLRSD